jgi:hypothetical protein
MFGVMLISPMQCLFVLLRVDEQVTEELGAQQDEDSEQELVEKASCALDHSSLPNNVPINHCDMLRLTWWDLIGYPSLVYFTPCLPLNFWVVSAIALCGFRCYDTYDSWSCFIIVTRLFIIHDKIMVLIGTWNLTWDNSATTWVEWTPLAD